MKLYFAPGACSLSPHIALLEGGVTADYEQVDLKAKTLKSGGDYREINPKGAVEEDYPLHVHTRDFLDKLKAKNRATNAPLGVGYNSALPCVLALEAMQQNRVLGWDAAARKSKAL